MSKAAFDKIREGLEEALEVSRQVEIPEDIMQAAREVCDNLITAWLHHHSREEAAEFAAKAILAERRRFMATLEEVGFAEKAGDHLNLSIDDDLMWADGEKFYRFRRGE